MNDSIKQREAEALKIYALYWESYQQGDVETFASTLDDTFELIGTSEKEVCHTKAEGLAFLRAQVDEYFGRVEMKNRQIKPVWLDPMVLINETNDIYVLSGKDWNFYATIRISTLLKETGEGWKVVQQHGSFPDMRVGEGETLAIEKISKENVELRDAVKRRTVELETKNRELEIETALERTRTQSMLMQHSDELLNISKVFHEQLLLLGIDSEFSFVWLPNEEKGDHLFWATWMEEKDGNKQFHVRAITYPLDMTEPYTAACFVDWQSGVSVHEHLIAPENIDTFFASWSELLEGAERLKPAFFPAGIYYTEAFMKYGCFGIDIRRPLSPQEKEILHRFAIEFERSYTRFLDLKKAESQAREAQIEAALERVRSRTMAMHNSEEVGESVAILFEELVALGVLGEDERCGIGIMLPKEKMEAWTAAKAHDGKRVLTIGHLDMSSHALLKSAYQGWIEKKDFQQYILQGEDLISYSNAIKGQPNYKIKLGTFLDAPRIIHCDFYFQEGCLYVFSKRDLLPESLNVYHRFAAVFGQTYRRYQDLQKAEAQAREAQIEAALERVRAQTMAMHSSEDVGKCVVKMFSELTALGVDEGTRFGIGILNHDNENNQLWTARKSGDEVNMHIGTIDMASHPLLKSARNAWKEQVPFHKYVLEGEDLLAYYQMLNNAPDYKIQIPIEKLPKKEVQHCFIFEHGFFYAFSPREFQPELIHITKRFSSLFEQTYRRYLDLVRAEAQTREATIEAALEKVRGKAMAMQNSNDISSTISIIFSELNKLGIESFRSGVGLISKETRKMKFYSSGNRIYTDQNSGQLVRESDLSEHELLIKLYDYWIKQEDYFPVLKGEQLISFYEKLKVELRIDLIDIEHFEQYGYCLAFSEGIFYGWSYKPYAVEEIRILHRFKSIVDLTFRRYIELQKSEEIAREAVRSASLDRVRAEIASMRTRQDLERITPLIWKELTMLGIPFVRCGVFIMDEREELIHTFLSTPDGKAIAAFHVPYGSTPLAGAIEFWRERKMYITHWGIHEYAAFADAFIDKYEVEKRAHYLSSVPKEGIHLHLLPFMQGMLYVGNTALLTADELNLIQSLADAFSTAYARYEDFNKLEAAKAAVESAMSELKATQAQLVQQEKLASLGQLTAGIAHEIKNPLNFVNNFSDVSIELIDEVIDEVKAQGIAPQPKEDIIEILADIKSNLSKIHEHGTRADGIVRSMLQHSRGGSGKKEPTDLNALVSEYVNLSFHGMQAGKQPIDVSIQFDLSPDVGEVDLITEDFSRVVVNLCNNAFDAMRMKTLTPPYGHPSSSGRWDGGEGVYKPKLTVRTNSENDHILISVKDNGPGIPEELMDKILQPFFTTKKGTEGTGLGLSITHDIVKAHGGELTVETKEGQGSTFIIQLTKNT